MKTLNTIKIIVADDHPLIREGFRVMLDKIPQFQLIGEAGDGEELILLSKKLRPDIVIVDIMMPFMNGIDAAKWITREFPSIGIIGLSMSSEGSFIADMLSAGAKGYLVKNAHIDEILLAIQKVYNGECYYCKESTQQLAQELSSQNSKKKKAAPVFTDTEILVIKFICEGLSTKQIASRLYLSPRTIEWHRHNILVKLDSKNIAAIVAYGIKSRLCETT